MRTQILLAFLILGINAGCGAKHNNLPLQANGFETIHQAEEGLGPDPHPDVLPMSLNNGEKWQMDEHTRRMIGQMNQRISSDLSGMALGLKLQDDLNELIAGCLMTGEAHNQLHAFLMQIMPVIDQLQAQGDFASEQRVSFLLDNYAHFFE